MTSPGKRPSQFTLATIVLVMTLVAVWLVLLRYSFWLAVAASIVFPAVVRAVLVIRHRRLQGEALSGGDRVELLVASLYMAVLTLLAAFFALAATTFLVELVLSPWKGSVTPETLLTDLAYFLGMLVALLVYLLVFWGFTFVERDLP
jgi:hypothetical protein